MLDLGWAELAFLFVLALVVVGPQDLPKLAHTIGKLWGKLQRFYRDSLQSIHKLETEMDLAAQADPRQQPSYYDLLPEHVRQGWNKQSLFAMRSNINKIKRYMSKLWQRSKQNIPQRSQHLMQPGRA